MHNIKISLRNLWKNRVTSIINLTGLTVALITAVFIFQWVYNELTFDRFNDNYKNIYMVASEWNYSDGKSDFIMETPTPLGPFLKDNFPEVKESTRFAKQFGGRFLEAENKKFLEDGLAVEHSFFDIFSIDFLNGDSKSIMDSPNSIYISHNLAKKFFDKENPMNRLITIFINPEETKDYVVCGVYKDIPDNSSLQFDFLIPISFDVSDNWYSFGSSTFLLLPDEIDKADLNKKISKFYNYDKLGFDINWYLHSLKNMHFHSDYQQFVYHPGDIQYIYIFIITGIFVLIIAVLNFMGLVSILISNRLKESGMRKIIGATKSKIVITFLYEPIIMVLVSVLITILAVEMIQNSFNSFVGRNYISILQTPIILTTLIILGLLIGLFSGIVPGIFTASINPFKAIKQNNESGRGTLRKYFIILQFTLSIVLLSSTLLIQRQLNYIFSKDLGFQKENIIHIPLSEESKNTFSLLKEDLLRNPLIDRVTNSSPLLSSGIEVPGWTWPGISKDQKHSIARINADKDFIESFKIKIVQGNNFSSSNLNSNKVLINEAAAKVMNMANPVNNHLQLKDQDYEIIGVVKDFHSRHFSHKIRPLIFLFKESGSNLYLTYSNSSDKENIVNTAKDIFEKYNSEVSFEYQYFAEEFVNTYRDESKMLKLLFWFVSLAFLILCFGLYGLSRQVAIRRTKEIGIRKVHGATISEVMLLLSKGFVKWVIIAFSIATPIVYLMIQKWLENFVYKTSLRWWVFLLSGIIALGIALLTVCWQSWRTATRNPVEALRYE